MASKLREEKSIQVTRHLEKEKEREENTRHWFVVPQAGVAWKNDRVEWRSGAGVGTKRVEGRRTENR